MADCPPLLLLTMRFLIAGMFMLGVAAVLALPSILNRRDLLVFAVLGIANQAAYLGLSYVGIRSISSGLAALMVSANPVLTAVLAALFLNDRMTWRKALGLLLGVGGVAFVVESRLRAGSTIPSASASLSQRWFRWSAAPSCSKARADGRPLDRQRRAKPCGRLATLPFAFAFENGRHRADLAAACGRSSIWRFSSPCSPICSGSTCSMCRARPRRVPITS